MNFAQATSFLIGTLIDLYTTAVMLRLLLQWVRADFYNPVCQFLVKVTNPLLIPIRRVIPSIGRLDTAACHSEGHHAHDMPECTCSDASAGPASAARFV